jgi:hypothetical protein
MACLYKEIWLTRHFAYDKNVHVKHELSSELVHWRRSKSENTQESKLSDRLSLQGNQCRHLDSERWKLLKRRTTDDSAEEVILSHVSLTITERIRIGCRNGFLMEHPHSHFI